MDSRSSNKLKYHLTDSYLFKALVNILLVKKENKNHNQNRGSQISTHGIESSSYSQCINFMSYWTEINTSKKTWASVMPTIRWPVHVMLNSSVPPLRAIIWKTQMQCSSSLLLPVRNADVHINLSTPTEWPQTDLPKSQTHKNCKEPKTDPCRTVLNHFQTNEIQFQRSSGNAAPLPPWWPVFVAPTPIIRAISMITTLKFILLVSPSETHGVSTSRQPLKY